MRATLLRSHFVLLLLAFAWGSTAGEVRLPRLVSDGMVLQRDAHVRIWGWAAQGEKVTVRFLGFTFHATAHDKGEWEVVLPEMKAGGPYDMLIEATNSITIHDIAIGDVWVCSGQSNMGLALGWLANVYQNDIDHSGNPFIRQFLVPVETDFAGRKTDLKSGAWQHANPKDVRNFSAVGYFFASKLYETYKVPIGLINASLGGSSTEAWISEESIRSFPKYHEEALRFKDPGLVEKIAKQDDEKARTWTRTLLQNDEGYKNPGQTWFDPDVNTADWGSVHVPGYWAESERGPVNGIYWYRRSFIVPAAMAHKPGLLKMGRIVDADSVFINGRFVGAMGFQYVPRMYRIPEDLLKEGENAIVVRVVNYIRHGGFVPGKPYEIVAGETKINLEGEWKYHVGATAAPLEDRLFTGKIPTGLFNGMIAPLLPSKIKGVLWYQGESNTSRAGEHYELFKLLIRDWRENWKQGDFPFVYAQLPNFVEVNTETTQYDWALFRESQLKALSTPGTGMAVSIDIGEWNDIHPTNKKDLGYRLALAAQKAGYGDNKIVYSGPLYSSMTIRGDRVLLKFTNVGSGLVARNGEKLGCFEVCGQDSKYYPAEARIENGTIVVWSDIVGAPLAVRYAWANNPEGANLYNKEGLPASPFRTSELY
jgi:sialate O-acetylesterase